MTTTATIGSWVAVHAGPNWRVWDTATGRYYRGVDGAVRVFRASGPAERRAAILNSGKDVSNDDDKAD